MPSDNGWLRTVSPVDGSIIAEVPLADERRIAAVLAAARGAQAAWSRRPVEDRAAFCSRAVDAFVANTAEIALEITWQMGRPVSQTPGEVAGFEERARHMIEIAPQALSDLEAGPAEGFRRFIRRDPLGVVLVMAPWNYPYLTAVNSVVPALLAGNAVILKHSGQTPLAAERFAEAFRAAGLPRGIFQIVHCTHEDSARMISGREVDFVAFTGSVDGGHAVVEAASSRFISTGLELGGKDPAYVRADAALAFTAENLVDGAFFNSGQSCCGIERIYVDREVFADFVDAFVEQVRGYRLGDPTEASTNLGPCVRTAAADFVRDQVAEAVSMGARALIDPAHFSAAEEGTPYLAPQVLVDVTHGMRVMYEESFGPVVGIMPVSGDHEAVTRMNDSDFGLTASIWTQDAEAALRVGEQVETGTWFMNRCDYLDPALAWTGVKDSGRGCTLSPLGFESLTRPKSYHLRLTGR